MLSKPFRVLISPLIEQMAGDKMIFAQVLDLRSGFAAFRFCVGAPVNEFTARRRVYGRRNFAFKFNALFPRAYLGIGNGNGGNEGLRVWVHRRIVDFAAFGKFHDRTEVHNCNPVGNMLYHRKVMRDKHKG